MLRRLACVLIPLGLASCASPPAHFYAGAVLPQGSRVAVLPLANYTQNREAPDRLLPAISVELHGVKGLAVVDAGEVEAALSVDPWLALDRIPPDVIDRFGEELRADLIVVGSVLAYGYRPGEVPPVPEVSLSLKFLETPGGRCVWSGTHSREGTDREHVFGIGRIQSVEQLAEETIAELLATVPVGPPLVIMPTPSEETP